MKKYIRLSFRDREEISRGIWAEESLAEISRRINRPTSTVSREVKRNNKYKWCYRAEKAQKRAVELRKQGRCPKKIDTNLNLKEYIYERLKTEWSPEEIANRVRIDYPRDNTMRISHESIYQYLYCLARGELKKELMKGLRQERKIRQQRKYAHYRKQRIQDIISISERPKEVKDRIVPGHWEGDLIVGKGHKSALGTLVERTTRLTLLVPLKTKDAFSVRKAMVKSFKRVPKQFRKTMTYDRGSEMSQHKLFTKETKIQVYFADPHSPWQRGTNENTNGLIRQYFPKGTDFRKVTTKAIRQAEQRLNSRPRKTLGYYTPSEKFYQLIKRKKVALDG